MRKTRISAVMAVGLAPMLLKVIGRVMQADIQRFHQLLPAVTIMDLWVMRFQC